MGFLGSTPASLNTTSDWMVRLTFCDNCGQQITGQQTPQISVAVSSPSPSTSPDLCSYGCAAAWLANRSSMDANNGVTTNVSPATDATTVTVSPATAMASTANATNIAATVTNSQSSASTAILKTSAQAATA